ncbi:hypothetical protein GCM10028796_13650 [Ramlibacter monticola]|uniref:Uncharacterized protein n=1 Tax=Ramlibacter monticola TaxID=1926872 RepID=A0A936YX56_9BURK|nr:hypothetical protein [Ramlibacter monticola]MBL0390201.1 hypothetical protein [Ramlibacter monticola]
MFSPLCIDCIQDNPVMPSVPAHRIIAANAYCVPQPFRAFAVRSDEPLHAFDARAPYDRVHAVRAGFLAPATLASLAAEGCARVRAEDFSEVEYAATTLQDLTAAAPGAADLVGSIAGGLQLTGVLGDDPVDYRSSVATRIDYLASRGAGFHNDVRGRWSRCLFWILALDAANVNFVMPHAGVELALVPGDLVVFDQTLAHGLCRPGDGLAAVEASFLAGDDCRQMFLTGEIALTDAQWAALGAPWLPVEEHERRGALDLMVAEFDDRSGAIKRPGELRHCMKRSTCYVDDSVLEALSAPPGR